MKSKPRRDSETIGARERMKFREQLTYNLGPGEHYEDAGEFSFSEPRVRVIAYYLPQFHPIPENDEWWGKGFTEWTNVTKALPRFEGHYQPHLPGELGFYDLRLPDTLRAQAKLARKFGIYGFCFHYYWFAGRKLLETPLNNLLANPDIDIRFCINWANESWSRRWDGSEADVLMEQRYSEADDIAFARALESIVRDPRYITIGGRPLIMLYRPRVLPDAAATVRRWREQFKSMGLPDPYIVVAQAFGEKDPRPFGMDAAAGFPPHLWWDLPSADNGAVQSLTTGYQGRRISYDELAQSAAEFDSKEYTQFPGVCPSWDNEARKPGRGMSFVGTTPHRYGAWLDNACRRTLRRQNSDERLVFVNAWNEWAEGTHLEPDRHFGYAYLNETGRVLSGLTSVSAYRNMPSVTPKMQSATKQWFRKAARNGATVLERFAMFLRSM
jgi:lipopolysaccharide biosynthesis protein